MSTRNVPDQAEVVITRKTLEQQPSKMPKWKSSRPEGAHRHWLKSLTTLLVTIAQYLGESITSGEVPSWMVKGKTTLILKDKNRGNLVSNFNGFFLRRLHLAFRSLNISHLKLGIIYSCFYELESSNLS